MNLGIVLCACERMVALASNAVAFVISKIATLADFGFYAVATVDVKELLGNEGAAGKGGALEPLKDQVKSYGGGSYNILKMGAIYIVGIALIGGAVFMALHAQDVSKRSNDKSAIGWILLAAVLVFGGAAILIFAQKIGEALFS